MFAILILYCFLQGTGAVIYRLNASDFARMPPLTHLDPCEACQQDADALYCSAELVLVSDKHSPLLDMIQEYSEHRATHYNRTKLHYGICVTQTCKHFYNKENGSLKYTLEACLNESLSEKYELKAKIIDEYYCSTPGKPVKAVDQLDIIVAVICFIILLANFVGTLCDIYIEKHKGYQVVIFLQCFSIKRNWNKLVTPASLHRYPRVTRLKCFHGMRVINMFFVIAAHSIFTVTTAIDNPEFIEKLITTVPWNGLANGTLIMQTFLLTSAFLLVYNWQLYSEQHEPSWSMLPKHVIIRWLRLTPTYALVLALTATWFGHLGSGPLWGKYVSTEMYDCRRHWWRNILYINNYYNDSRCMVQGWYLATDTHLYYMAVILYLACRTPRSRIITLSLLFIIGLFIPAIHVYIEDLDGVQMVSPRNADSIFMDDPHFNSVYKRTHTNVPSYVIGIALAYLVYEWQQRGVDVKKFQTLPYSLLYWSLFPLGLAWMLSGMVFYFDAPRMSIYFRMATSVLMKPVFGLLVAILVTGFIFKFEDTYRCILEWRGWTVFSRLSYGAYMLHVAFIRNYVAALTYTNQAGIIISIQTSLSILVATIIAAFFLWILVEAPISNVLKECLLKSDTEAKIEYKEKSKSLPNNDHQKEVIRDK